MALDIALVTTKLKIAAKIMCVWRAKPENICCSLDDMATELNMSRRTLQRKLKEENTCYLTLQDNARLDLTRCFLAAGKSVEEISDSLGFADRRCFTRAFKRWTGAPPRVYKKQQ
ncbi:helix-turn-helix domain-containing protein [Alkalimarinus alittae]|uniref:AraC family transcriptional regulator n=1 Tax=Alkalimarinus alittae TaxID=2961619 RepID=A0ABY6N4I5_9ALTE|nr:AraC family transcriptional regulator [Alkalimarinus alittae]UZE97008.1 AraC family transcriptional regulator [Alkalimarinus alittae]